MQFDLRFQKYLTFTVWTYIRTIHIEHDFVIQGVQKMIFEFDLNIHVFLIILREEAFPTFNKSISKFQ